MKLLTSENGILAKLATLRQNFLSGVDEARTQFVTRIKTLREDYLSQVVDATLGDPKLSEVERALGSWNPAAAVAVPSQASAPPPAGMVPLPEKWPKKGQRFVNIYGSCPNCNSPIYEPQAKFCSQCAFPLDEAWPR